MVVIRGTISANEDLRLNGRVEGSIDVPNHVLTVGPEGRIEGEIRAKGAVIEGIVVGDVRATDRLVLAATGALDGDIEAPRLEIREGARFDGRIRMPPRIRAVTTAA
jgi:cytoskeletal protein CcmA (bactofilin family)